MTRSSRIVTVMAILTLCAGGANARADDHPVKDEHAAPASNAPTDAVGSGEKSDKPSPFKSGSRAKRKAPAPAAEPKPTLRTDAQGTSHDEPAAAPKATAKASSTPIDEHDAHAVDATATSAVPLADPALSTSLPEAGSMAPDAALALLQAGNQRWIENAETNPSTQPERRERTAQEGQRPFATILTCADSRIPVERVFDRGVGELFTIRVAGNVAGTSETGTIEYGLGHLKTRLLVVMGHTKCGAVAAAASGAQLHGAVGELVGQIAPAVDRARKQHAGADETGLVTAAVRENVWQSAYQLLKSDEVRSLVESGQVKLVGAVYDIASGKVEWLGEHPWQAELIVGLNARKTVEPAVTATAPEHGE